VKWIYFCGYRDVIFYKQIENERSDKFAI
jgi:hypothetical protein